jgi:DNA end-binding protein Ku
VNERTGDEVDYADIVKGHDVGGGEYVIVEPEELDEIAPGRSRTIDITAFVDLDEIAPVFFQKTYWLGPAKSEYLRPYGLLAQAMAKTNRAGIAKFVMRGKQYLTALRADEGVIALETLYFADEIRDPQKMLDEVTEVKAARGKELTMATSLIESMSEPWRPEDYRDTYTERVNELVEDKQKGRETVTEAAPPEATEITDLMEALRRSVEGVKGRGRSAKKKPVEDLSGLSKAELEKRARELGVPGRSKMNADELRKAVADAMSGSSRKAS